MKLILGFILALVATQLAALAVPSHSLGGFRVIEHPDPDKRALLQDLVDVLQLL
jgi:hypothetical protein